MTDTADYDQIVKTVSKMIDDWGKAIEKIGKQLADVQDEIDKMDALKKQREDLKKNADAVSKDLTTQLQTYKLPPKVDPQQLTKLPDFLTKYVGKNGLKLGPTISVMPDFKVDLKKPAITKAGLTLTVEW
jgi:hypothetical protein